MASASTRSADAPDGNEALDAILKALADPTRRRVIERLAQRPASATELIQPFKMAMPSLVQHLRVLEACGLVRSTKAGRVRTYEVAPEPLARLEGWLSAQRRLWETRLDRLDEYLVHLKNSTEPPKQRESSQKPREGRP